MGGAPQFPVDAGELAEMIGYRLRLAEVSAYQAFVRKLTGHEVAPRYLGLLAIIRRHPCQPQSRQAEAIGLRRSSLVPIIDRLEVEGLVERRPSRKDRRLKSVQLTQKGLSTVGKLLALARPQEKRIARGMSEADRTTLLHLLVQVAQNLLSEGASPNP